MYKPKSNQYYIDCIQKECNRVFSDKHSNRQAKTACNMLQKRLGWALNNGSINESEYKEVMSWLNKCRSWIYA